MMKRLWTLFGERSDISDAKSLTKHHFTNQTLACLRESAVTGCDLVILVILSLALIKRSCIHDNVQRRLQKRSRSQILCAPFNGSIGFVYLFIGAWIFEKNVFGKQTVCLIGRWFSELLHGFIWLLAALTISLPREHPPATPSRLLAVLLFLVSINCSAFSLWLFVQQRVEMRQLVLDAVSVSGAVFLLHYVYRGYRNNELDGEGDIYAPLNSESIGEINPDSGIEVTPFARAGILSVMTFRWLSPLMKKGTTKTIMLDDIPKLREKDRAESCYKEFIEQQNLTKDEDQSLQPSFLRIIIRCYAWDIAISGFFALLKIVTLSIGPLLLNAFILVAEGKGNFVYEGCILAVTFFLCKSLETLSQRQWYFRARLIGLKVRSVLMASIYGKQLKLCSESRLAHSGAEIMNYVNVDAYRIGEFPYWFHQIWTTSLQLCISLVILYRAVGLAVIAALIVIILTVLCNAPLAKLQNKFQLKLLAAQDERLKACTEALTNMKVLKLYAWETHFKNAIEALRKVEQYWLRSVQLRKAYNSFLFWSSPVLVSAATFGACNLLNIPLHANNVFTFVAAVRLVQDPIRSIPDVIAVFIQARVSFARITRFLEAPELHTGNVRLKSYIGGFAITIKSATFSWEQNSTSSTLREINLDIRRGEKVAISGEVGSGKSTLLTSILGELPATRGNIQVYGRIAYVSQTAWIQSGTIQENILFGSPMDAERYHTTLKTCSLVKDLDLFPFGDLTEIGERGVNLSGGQKQRIQLARALYQDADIYLLDDPFSAVDAETATSLFNEYVMGALAKKTVLLVTHQVDFLPAFDSVLLMVGGEIIRAAPYQELLATSKDFQDLVNAHKETAGSERLSHVSFSQRIPSSSKEISKTYTDKIPKVSNGDQLIKQEEREVGDTGLTPYRQYLGQNKGYIYLSFSALGHLAFVAGQISQNSWMAANVDSPKVTMLKLIAVYVLIGCSSLPFLLGRTCSTVILGLESSTSLFTQLMNSLFRAPMSFYDCTPLGRILSRISYDLSIVDLDVPFFLIFAIGSTINAYSNLGVLVVITWQVLFVSVPLVFVALRLQKYFFASAKEFMRINGTTKSLVANHLAESVAGATTIRAFEEEERFFAKNLDLIDTNASPYFHNFAANEWLIQRLEIVSASVLASTALCLILLPSETYNSGFIGMALSYGLSLNASLVFSIQNQCSLANSIISVERINQYMNLPSEAPEVIEDNRPRRTWPEVGKVDIQDLEIRYRPDAPLVLKGITCTFNGGDKIGVVGRTGSGKSTLIGALFRLVEPAGGRIVVDGIDISKIGLHDLRSRFGIIPQDPTLFNGTVRYNLDPLSQHTDQLIWEVLEKCQLREVIKGKRQGLESMVVEDGSNWSLGQRQLFCLGRALLRRSRVLVLDEATASIDNATDLILQRTIRSEFADCTVITVAHRIPTVMDCTKVLAISAGKLMEYDEPMTLINKEGSLFGKLVKEYWSQSQSTESLVN